jgi:hypothetical protein
MQSTLDRLGSYIDFWIRYVSKTPSKTGSEGYLDDFQ